LIIYEHSNIVDYCIEILLSVAVVELICSFSINYTSNSLQAFYDDLYDEKIKILCLKVFEIWSQIESNEFEFNNIKVSVL